MKVSWRTNLGVEGAMSGSEDMKPLISGYS